jgi:hypothetical protein
MYLVGSNLLGGEPFVRKERRSVEVVFEEDLKTIEDTHVFPSRGRFVIIFREDCLEPIIVDKMVLGRDVASAKVTDKANSFGVNRGDTHILGPAGARGPLGNLVTRSVEARVENIGGTTPSMKIAKSLVITDDAGEGFDRSDARRLVRGVVVHVDSVGKGHGPQGFIVDFRPVEGGMKHHSSSTRDNNTDGAFGHTVLPFGTNTTETNSLDIGVNFMVKALAIEDTVVGMVGVDEDTAEECHTFEPIFGQDSV